MGILIVFGKPLNWSDEIELTVGSEFGLNCTLFMKDGKISYRRNCTEFHHRFKEGIGDREASAFESDIHSTGGVVELDKVDRIEVELASHLYDEHFG